MVIDITMTCDISIECVFSQLKRWKYFFLWENTATGIELPRKFCAGISPLQRSCIMCFQSTYMFLEYH